MSTNSNITKANSVHDSMMLNTRYRITPDVISRILAIEGVDICMALGNYKALVYKGAIFTWDEVLPRLLDLGDQIASETATVKALVDSVEGEA